jgi:MFS family permease
MLTDLKMGYSMFAVASAFSTLMKILAYEPVGRLADRFGDKPIAVISYTGTALLPLMCLFIHAENSWLMFVAMAISGLAWAGADITTFNFLLGLTDKKHRAAQAATYNTVTSSVMILAPILGGMIADYDGLGLKGLALVFAIATVLRVIAGLLFTRISEPRAKHETSVAKVFGAITAHTPANGIMQKFFVAVKRYGKL